MADWDELHRELDLWHQHGRVATFWWRDDDAFAPTRPLTDLLDLADEFGLSIALAAVPEQTGAALVGELACRPRHELVQHGYCHRNHGRTGEPAVECGGDRPVAQVLGELQRGRERLERLFGARFHPILVPPWNRISPSVVKGLASAGFRGISTFGPRRAEPAAATPTAVNAHFDVLRWRGGARFRGRDRVLGELLGNLRARRTGLADADEAIGLLTHHNDHDGPTWDFLRSLLRVLAGHPGAKWVGVVAAFGLAPSSPAPTQRRPA